MDGCEHVANAAKCIDGLALRFEFEASDPNGIECLKERFGERDLALVLLFVSHEADFAGIMRAAHAAFPDCHTLGCTTAGEIGRAGYANGLIVAVGFPSAHFAVDPQEIETLEPLDRQALITAMIRKRAKATAAYPDMANEFALLLVDGLSLMEDQVASACADALGPVPMFGGSAGDGTRFSETALALNGKILKQAAVLTYLRTDCRVKVFTTNHLKPTDQRMVVTSADPSRRVVREINAEPAAREYARLLGKDPEQLDRFTFAAHPVAVRFGGRHQVRAIQHVSETGELVFFSAIEEGLVLSLAEPENMAEHLERELRALSAHGTADTVLAFDCILRRLEAEERQLVRDMSDILQRHGVVGFSTYGEQMGGMHMNQTLTGVAIYPPAETRSR